MLALEIPTSLCLLSDCKKKKLSLNIVYFLLRADMFLDSECYSKGMSETT